MWQISSQIPPTKRIRLEVTGFQICLSTCYALGMHTIQKKQAVVSIWHVRVRMIKGHQKLA